MVHKSKRAEVQKEGRFRVPVESTTLASAGHDANSATLELQFRSGAVYRYFAVPQRVFEDLLQAKSKGLYFNQNIRDKYPYNLVQDAAGVTHPIR
jgi:hypothetical protein